MSEEKGIWAAEAWETPELRVVVYTGKETRKETINRTSVKDATLFDIVTQYLGLMKGAKEIVVEVDGKAMKPSESQKIAASTIMEITMHPSEMKKESVVPVKAVVDRKYHQHRGIVGGHKLTDRHKDPEAQRYHVDELRYYHTYEEA